MFSILSVKVFGEALIEQAIERSGIRTLTNALKVGCFVFGEAVKLLSVSYSKPFRISSVDIYERPQVGRSVPWGIGYSVTHIYV